MPEARHITPEERRGLALLRSTPPPEERVELLWGEEAMEDAEELLRWLEEGEAQ